MSKVIVSQYGSRHRYLIPEILHQKGLLKYLYTDSTSDGSFLGKIASFLSRFSNDSTLKRLEARKPKLPSDKVKATDILIYKKFINLVRGKNDPYSIAKVIFQGMASVFIKWGVSDAGILYNMYIENADFLRYCKQKGLKVVVDIYEDPTTYERLVEEIDSHPDVGVFRKYREIYIDYNQIRADNIEEILAISDFYTVPSEFVNNALKQFKNYSSEKVRIIPYAASLSSDKNMSDPIKGRVIWVGSDALRKGLIYCAMAARILKERFPYLDFRVIGESDEDIINSPAFEGLNFIGILNKEDLVSEYVHAEAYVFPTLSEGFAGTMIEAASFGCPIITTECAGCDIDKFPAIFIPTKSVESIVESISKLFLNRDLRNELSQKSYDYSKEFSLKNYSDKLSALFDSLV